MLFQNSCTGYWRKNGLFGLDYLPLILWAMLVRSFHSIPLFGVVIQLDIYSFLHSSPLSLILWLSRQNTGVADVFLKAQGFRAMLEWPLFKCLLHYTQNSLQLMWWYLLVPGKATFVRSIHLFILRYCKIHLYLTSFCFRTSFSFFFLPFCSPWLHDQLIIKPALMNFPQQWRKDRASATTRCCLAFSILLRLAATAELWGLPHELLLGTLLSREGPGLSHALTATIFIELCQIAWTYPAISFSWDVMLIRNIKMHQINRQVIIGERLMQWCNRESDRDKWEETVSVQRVLLRNKLCIVRLFQHFQEESVGHFASISSEGCKKERCWLTCEAASFYALNN